MSFPRVCLKCGGRLEAELPTHWQIDTKEGKTIFTTNCTMCKTKVVHLASAFDILVYFGLFAIMGLLLLLAAIFFVADLIILSTFLFIGLIVVGTMTAIADPKKV